MRHTIQKLVLLLATTFSFAQIPTTGLIKDYKFTNGAITSDVTPLLQVGNTTLVPTGSARTILTDRNTEANKAILLNGDSFTAGGTNAGSVNSYAVSLWVKTTTNESPNRYILDQHQTLGSNPGGFSVSLKDGKIYFRGQYNYNVNSTYTSSPVTEIISNIINDGQWHHVVCQVSSTSTTTIAPTFTSYTINYVYSMYIDNALVNTLNSGTNVGVPNGSSYSRRAINPTQQLFIGKSIDNANLGYNDAIDQIRYYESGLSTADVDILYNEDKVKIPIYVNVNATGSNNGTSWTNAYTNLEPAITQFTAANEIWVAAGTYKPTATTRVATFSMKNSLKLYGGFNGTETLLNQRNPKTNITILSGDVNGNDNTTVTAAETTRQDNLYHVITVRGNVKNIIIDGFTISGGNANGPTLTSGAASAQYYHTRGGAIYINPFTALDHPGITVKNCVLEKNSGSDTAVFATYYAGGLNSQYYTATIESCIVRNNFSGTNAQFLISGASGYDWIANCTISNSLFHNNTSNGPSCLYLSASLANGGNATGINATIINSTFSNNTGLSGNVIRTDNGTNSSFRNSIIYGNGSATPINSTGAGTALLLNTISQGGQISGINSNPNFTPDYKLQLGSPAIDAGNNSHLPVNTNFDLSGNSRIVNTTVDMGAYEYDVALNNTSFQAFKEFKVYPNPASNEIFIDCNESLSDVKLFSFDGKLLLETQNKHLSIQQIPSGIYLLVLETESGQIGNQKIIKN
jgi:hypothetical protein